ncbi:MAG: nickel pincer cofactor biosynthesis protein LarC [Acidobacteriota bacterium]
MNIAYFDCFSGISGDMILGALIDSGLPAEALLDEIKKLPVEGYSFKIARERRGSIGGTRVKIEIGHQPSRTYTDIKRMIEESTLDAPVKEKSLAVFERLAKAEASVHHMPVSEVHFHEVGALDSILDVVGAAIGLNRLGIERVYGSRVPLGGGTVKTHHGLLPVPAPATVLLLSGVPVYDNGVARELVTPTGAAILTTFAEGYGVAPEMTLEAVGYGVGSNPASDPPNLLRLMRGTTRSAYRERELLLIEANIDDMNPEFYNYVQEELFALGVLDVGLVPVQMKKNRPGVLLRALVEPGLQGAVVDVFFRETTTLGVRIQEVRRIELPREAREIRTVYGVCRVKWVAGPDGEERMIPEYEECRRLAREHRVPLRKVYEEVSLAARRGGEPE